ncbi:acetyl-CoA synthetase-like protein [Athelia psychrophila]|uniref:Acetyl-CoA synthetase-like protein n=1 Tax=Athelia psychrophila TaxID=1759441 RepID=A0A166QUY2_9AGAM|nr:acetyl-CoA synthetase-like protein [Fibularhizoctonia sp. CBS 109695]KZP27580.1 acetyl-CoA synthetase-like protein [Fibularhizoctonia sp. CBS 109695]
MSDLSYNNFRALADRVASTPDAPVFKLPDLLKPGNWVDVPYSQFQTNIHHMAKFWNSKLTSRGIAMGSVIGVWIRGFTYPDVITIFALSRAGFIPQMMPFEMPNSTLALSLLAKTDAQAIVHSSEKTEAILDTGTKLHRFEDVNFAHVLEVDVAHIPLPVLPEAKPESIVWLYHTSGSVSGIPKVVPIMNKWLASIEHKSGKTFPRNGLPGESQDTWNWIGPQCQHCAMLIVLAVFQHVLAIGGCVVQPSRYDCKPTELVEMIENAGVTRMFQFGMTVKEYFEFAKSGVPEPRLLGALKGLRQVTYSGMALPKEWEDWAYAQGIPLTTVFGSTEAGEMLTSSFGDRRLEVLDATKYEFSPADITSVGGHEYASLLEFRILPDSPDVPHPSLCDADGGWRSGDLFEELEPGKYLFRGRDDDWLQSFWAEKIDTKAIEENVYETCPDLVNKCTVVGDSRPFPALFIEGKNAEEDADALRSKVLERISEFQHNLYLHERITNVNMIKVVPANSLTRSRKGGVRRRAVEEQFKEEIEAMYASVNVDDVFAGVYQG